MIENISDRNGRAFEYTLSLEVAKLPNFSLTHQSEVFNRRDAGKYESLPDDLKNSFNQASVAISAWIFSKFSSEEQVQINRLNDDPNNVADLTFTSNLGNQVQVSLKHNHEALKHPRPYSLAQFCGYTKNSAEDLKHRLAMKNIVDNFRSLEKGKTTFPSCERESIDNLYNQVCLVCKNSLEEWCKKDKGLPSNLFQFIVNTGFYKIILNTRGTQNQIIVQDYLSKIIPSNLVISANLNRLVLAFDNGWQINLRIHTASSRISSAPSQLSLKFDAQKTAGTVNQIQLQIP